MRLRRWCSNPITSKLFINCETVLVCEGTMTPNDASHQCKPIRDARGSDVLERPEQGRVDVGAVPRGLQIGAKPGGRLRIDRESVAATVMDAEPRRLRHLPLKNRRHLIFKMTHNARYKEEELATASPLSTRIGSFVSRCLTGSSASRKPTPRLCVAPCIGLHNNRSRGWTTQLRETQHGNR
jgi:hypothetical protein